MCIFIDADIRIRDDSLLEGLISDLGSAVTSHAITSKPVKDLSSKDMNPVLRFVAGQVSRIHRNGPIAGSLYAVRSALIRNIRLPVPSLVEDGFLSGCIITEVFSHDPNPDLVLASTHAEHYFTPPRTLSEFFRHDVRLSLGSEMNAALYSPLWAEKTIENRQSLLRSFGSLDAQEPHFIEHEKHPQRSALKFSLILRQVFSKNYDKGPKWLLKLPMRIIHGIYMDAVRRRARVLFRTRKFRW